MDKNVLKNVITMSLNSMEKTKNPNQLEATFVVHDFTKSWNNGLITEEVCEENKEYLLGQYICCKYYSKEENNGEDALGTHEVGVEINRDTGEEMMSTGTVAIGYITEVFITEGTTSDGTEGKVFCCKAILWLNKYYNVLSFIDEMLSQGITIPCSVEYGYKNFSVKDGVCYVESPVYYEALCILNPVDRGEIKQVLPAYDCSKFNGFSFNEAIVTDINNINEQQEEKNQKEGDDKFMTNVFRKAFNMSMGETRDKIYDALEKQLTAEEYNNMWLSLYSIQPDHIVYETYVGEEWKVFKINYAIQGEDVVVDFGSKVEIKVTIVEEEVQIQQEEELKKVQNSLTEKEEQLSTLEAELLNTKEATLSLNTKIGELEVEVGELLPYKEKVVKMEYDQKLEEVKSTYKEKFVSLNALEKFEEEEVQNLVKDILETEKSLNAKLALADMLVDLVSLNTNTNKNTDTYKEVCNKKVKNLVPVGTKSSADYCGLNL